MNARKCYDLAELPGRARSGGHVYILLFNNGTVKVGSTTNPSVRIRTHQVAAANFGLSLTRFWVSRSFVGHIEAETDVIAAAMQVCASVVGREWFQGVDYDALVERAPFLTYTNPGGAVLARKAAERRAAKGEDPAGYRTNVDLIWRSDETTPPLNAFIKQVLAEAGSEEERQGLLEAWVSTRAHWLRRGSRGAAV
ncbi:GIY-YIG nuclease family protein [Micromonospora sp. NPDC005174]|uniref:GIY-YIG nuclease family protein n=1 Tax=Micromonospora sp. NPDC005174 TaxID=3157018 RepID=UPI0033B9EA5E